MKTFPRLFGNNVANVILAFLFEDLAQTLRSRYALGGEPLGVVGRLLTMPDQVENW